MEIKTADEETQSHIDQKRPLLRETTIIPSRDEKTLIQKAISQTFRSTANLANLLPTGTVLAFQLLSPIFTNQGNCDSISRYLTAGLVALCGLSCFFQSFTDSFRDSQGNVSYGFATFRGLWVIDGSVELPPTVVAASYRLRFIDFLHAFMSILVFSAVALFDENVVNCFLPDAVGSGGGDSDIFAGCNWGVFVVCCLLLFLPDAMELVSLSLLISGEVAM